MKLKEDGILKNNMGTENKMNRKEAITKAGYIALSAATTMILISGPKKAAALSPTGAPAAPDSGDTGKWTKRTT